MRIAMIGQKGIQTGARGGGIEMHVEAIATRLVKSGHHDVFVYARRRHMERKENRLDGVYVVYLPTLYRKNLEAIVHTFLATLHALFGSYDIIHYHGVGPATLAWIPRLFLRHTKVVVTFHSQDRFHSKWSWFARFYLYFGEWAAVIFPHACIAVSHTIQVFCRERFGRDVIYIPNGAEERLAHGDEWLKRFGFRKQGYLLHAGRMVPHKGVHLLVDAYRSLKQDGVVLPDLALAGAPSFTETYMGELKKRAAGDSQIHFLGFQEGEALAELFTHALLFVHPSMAEGLPLVVLEAMSYGLPVLVSDIPENLEAMHHAGFTFVSKDVEDLKRQLRHLLEHREVLLAARARSRATVKTYFHWDKIAKETEEVYRTVRH